MPTSPLFPPSGPPFPLESTLNRRRWLQQAAAGTLVTVLGATYVLADEAPSGAHEPRKDGRKRVPPGQRVLSRLRPMGGESGSPARSDFKLKVYGEVEHPFELNFDALLASSPVELPLDVHCVTGWSVLGARFKGVRVADLAQRAGLKPTARHVIFEGAHGYSANVALGEALKPEVLVAYELDGRPLERGHGAPVRAVVPDLYFWKSAKWLTAIRFVERDQPGYWEVRGYNNHGDPWREERYA